MKAPAKQQTRAPQVSLNRPAAALASAGRPRLSILSIQEPAFFLLFFVCLWKWVDVELIYHGGGVVRAFPVFSWDWDFAHDVLRYPGGGAEYVSALLAQTLYYSWLGAVVLTLQAWLILSSFRHFLKSLGAGRTSFIAFLAPLLLLTFYAGYRHASAPVTALAITAVFLWLYQLVRGRGILLRSCLVLVLASALYVLAPAGLAVLSLTVAISELRQRASWPVALLALGLLAILPGIEGVWLFGLGASEAYAKLLPFIREPKVPLNADSLTLCLLYWMLPVLSAIVAAWRVVARRWPIQKEPSPSEVRTGHGEAKSKAKQRGAQVDAPAASASGTAPRPRSLPTVWGQWLETACLLGIILVVMKLAHYPEVKSILAADDYAWHGRWPEAIAAASRYSADLYLSVTKAQAAYHLDRLTLALPRLRTADDLLLAKEGPVSDWRKSDLYYDLGYANMALHYLVESVEVWGQRPALLERLALLNLALGNRNTAEMYFKALLKVPFHSSWARDHLQRLATDPLLESDPDVSRLRSLLLRRDSVVRLSLDGEMLSLLDANPGNRMAFEYLMTYYLLAKNLSGFVQNLPRAQSLPGFRLSPLWEEALVMAADQALQPVDLKGHPLDSDAQHRFEAIRRVLAATNGNKELAASQLHEYENTYFYYFLFR